MARKYTDPKERAKKSLESAARVREARMEKRRTGNPKGRPKKGAKYKRTQRNDDQQKALNQRLGQARQQASICDLRRWLEEVKNKNRCIPITEAAAALNRKHNWFRNIIGCGTFAQLYLEMNPDCGATVRTYYESMIEREKVRAESNLTLNINVGDKRMTTRIDSDTVKGKLATLDNLAQVQSSQHDSTLVKVTEPKDLTPNEQAISRIREKYIGAPIGEMPTIDGIMREYGLLDKDARPTTSLSEVEVRRRALDENWNDERKSSLHRRWDVIDDEVKMVTTMRNLDVQKTIFQTIKLVSRAVTQYYTTGVVTSVQADPITGKTRELNIIPDPNVIAGLAEVMRRMTDSNKEINIQINQFNNIDQNNSLFIKQYASRLANLSHQDLEDEISKIVKIRSVLDDKFQDALLAEAIEAEVLR
jgi:hypothetical protein